MGSQWRPKTSTVAAWQATEANLPEILERFVGDAMEVTLEAGRPAERFKLRIKWDGHKPHQPPVEANRGDYIVATDDGRIMVFPEAEFLQKFEGVPS